MAEVFHNILSHCPNFHIKCADGYLQLLLSKMNLIVNEFQKSEIPPLSIIHFNECLEVVKWLTQRFVASLLNF